MTEVFLEKTQLVAPMGSKHLPGGAFNRSLTREALHTLIISAASS
jgi:hypothetical protein